MFSKYFRWLPTSVDNVVALIALALALTGCGGSSRPTPRDVEQRLAFENTSLPLTFDVEKVDSIPESGGKWNVRFSGSAELKEPLFRRIDLADALRQSAKQGFDLAQLRQAASDATKLTSANRERFKAEIDAIAALPSSVLLPGMKAGEDIAFAGEGLAEPVGNSWSVTISSMKLASGRDLLSRADASQTPIFDSEEVLAKLRQVSTLAPRFPDAVVAASREEQAERERAEASRRAAQLKVIGDTLAPGSFLLGTYQRRGEAEQTQIAIEIVSFDESDRTFVAHVRNEGSYRSFRQVAGSVRESQGQTQIVLTFAGSNGQPGHGPVMDWDDPRFDLVFQFNDDSLQATTNNWTIRMRVAKPEALAKFRQQSGALENQLAALLAAGSRLSGVGRRKSGTEPELLMIEVTDYRLEDNAISVNMTDLRCPGLVQEYSGTVVTNAILAAQEDATLVLSRKTDKSETLDNAFFGGGTTQLKFTYTAGALELRSHQFGLTLKAFSAADHSAWLAEWNARRAQWRSAISPGMRYRGAIVSSGGRPPLSVDIVWTTLDEDGKLLTMKLIESNGKQSEFRGGVQLDQVLRVAMPIVLEGKLEHWDIRLSMTLDANGRLVGKVSGGDRTFTLNPVNGSRSTPAAQTPSTSSGSVKTDEVPTAAAPYGGQAVSADGYPSGLGAYLLIDGEWTPLPRNNSRVTQNAINLLGSLVASVNGTPIATLVLNGSDPVPAVKGKLTIFYRGNIAPSTGAPAGYPLAEIASTTLDDKGARKTTLYRIAPGLAGFGESRLPAQVTAMTTDSLLLTVDAVPTRGSYALTAGRDAFEFRVP